MTSIHSPQPTSHRQEGDHSTINYLAVDGKAFEANADLLVPVVMESMGYHPSFFNVIKKELCDVAHHPQCTACLAVDENTQHIVGFTTWFPCSHDDPWFSTIGEYLGDVDPHTVIQCHDLYVLPTYQRYGIGSSLMTIVRSDNPQKLVALTTENPIGTNPLRPDAHTAVNFYTKCGAQHITDYLIMNPNSTVESSLFCFQPYDPSASTQSIYDKMMEFSEEVLTPIH